MEQIPTDSTFLQDLFVKERTFTDKEWIEIDQVFKGQTIATYVARDGDSTKIGKSGFNTKLHFAPYINEEITYTSRDVDSRMAGQTRYDTSASQVIGSRTAGWLDELQKRIVRREEQQVAEALRTGKVAVSGVDTSYTVDFGMNANHIITNAGNDKWDSGADDKVAQLETWAALIADKGAPTADVLVMGLSAAQQFKKDTNILSMLDNRRILGNEINIRQIANQRASFIGTFTGCGLNIDCYCYQGLYVDSAGANQRYLPTDRVILGSTQSDVRFHYAKIENLLEGDFMGRWFPLQWIDPNGKKGHITLESSPLVGFHQPDGFVSVDAL
jgi:hypothetical protein